MADFDQKRQTVEVQQNADTIQNEIPFEKFVAFIQEQRDRYETLLKTHTVTEYERQQLQKQLDDVIAKQVDSKRSYEAYLAELKERIARLDSLVGQLPSRIIEDAKQALASGDTSAADALFSQVEEQALSHIEAAAEAAWQRGKLAEDAVNYSQARDHYLRANQLQPDSTEYIDSLGTIYQVLGDYRASQTCFKQALESDLATYGVDHPEVAVRRNNLASVLKDLGQYEQAKTLFEQSLASGIATYGEDHPEVAVRRNNLAGVLMDLGEYEPAKTLLQQALAVFQAKLGSEHPKTRLVEGNMLTLNELMNQN